VRNAEFIEVSRMEFMTPSAFTSILQVIRILLYRTAREIPMILWKEVLVLSISSIS
ncbi:hypothetical protein MKX03_026210, partial [Papaver bracteatum]